MLVVSIDDDEALLRAKWPPYQALSAPVRAALLDMAYNLGVNGLLGFKDMVSALERGDYDTAADEALDSVWARRRPDRASGWRRLFGRARHDMNFIAIAPLSSSRRVGALASKRCW